MILNAYLKSDGKVRLDSETCEIFNFHVQKVKEICHEKKTIDLRELTWQVDYLSIYNCYH